MPKLPIDRLRELVPLLSRYGAVGLLNTGVSLSIIMVLDRAFGASPAMANAAGFAVGIMCNFVLSRRFVFRSSSATRTTAPKYLVAVAAGFCLNQIALAEVRALLGDGTLNHLIAQVCGMASYTLSVFTLCRFWVFRAPIDPVIATA